MTNVLKRDRDRRRKRAERARARAKHFFEQLIKITVSAISGGDSLVIQFNNLLTRSHGGPATGRCGDTHK